MVPREEGMQEDSAGEEFYSLITPEQDAVRRLQC
jgi:hypothetical protein